MNVPQISPPRISQELKDFIGSYPNFLIAGHKEPDGDCIGSALGLSLFLHRLKKNVALLSAGPFKRSEIMPYKQLFSDKLPAGAEPSSWGLIIVDCSDFHRVGSIGEFLTKFNTIYIDHHQTNPQQHAKDLVKKDAPSTTYLVQSIIEEISGVCTQEEAEFLLFGLCSDTGFFRHLENNSADVFLHVARLVQAGASPKQTFMQLSGGRSLGSRLLIARILERITSYYEGRLIISYETLTDRQEFGLEGRDSDMLYQLLQSIAGVLAVVIVRQESETHCSVGFRSISPIDVSIIASAFGGGGHKQASGLYIEGLINELIPQFVEAFAPQLKTNNK